MTRRKLFASATMIIAMGLVLTLISAPAQAGDGKRKSGGGAHKQQLSDRRQHDGKHDRKHARKHDGRHDRKHAAKHDGGRHRDRDRRSGFGSHGRYESGAHRRRDDKHHSGVTVRFGSSAWRHGRTTTVLVKAGYYRDVWIDAVYEVRTTRCGRKYSVQVEPGYSKKIWVPPVYETVRVGPHPRYGHGSGLRITGHIRF